MPKKEIGLMGRVGEAVVEQWLQKKYPAPEYQIVYQIMPKAEDFSIRGGGYLDFGVIKNNKVVAVYEVKSQDFILGKSFKINKALRYLWKKRKQIEKGQKIKFYAQDDAKRVLESGDNFKTYLILLVGPNEQGERNIIGKENIKNVLLFSDICKELRIDQEELFRVLKRDAAKLLKVLEEPTQGKKVNKSFLRKRGDPA